jgi:hypothetical protein
MARASPGFDGAQYTCAIAGRIVDQIERRHARGAFDHPVVVHGWAELKWLTEQ